MIKARVTNPLNGRVYLVLGVTEENLKRLEAGDPIGVLPKELGFTEAPDMIVLVRGRNEADVAEQIERMSFVATGLVMARKKS